MARPPKIYDRSCVCTVNDGDGYVICMSVMMMGFSESEARLGLRACQGDIQRAVAHIVQRREVRGHDFYPDPVNSTVLEVTLT